MAQDTLTQKNKLISKSRITFGILFIFIGLILFLSLGSYLWNWKADQSQAGQLLDRQIVSSNVFGKVGDWLGDLFIFHSIGVAGFLIAFLMVVYGTVILKKKYFKPWKTTSHSLFFICWLPIFFGALAKGEGVLPGVYGFETADYIGVLAGKLGLWMILIVSLLIYFVLEFNLNVLKIGQSVKDKMPEFSFHKGESDLETPLTEEENEKTPEAEEETPTEAPKKPEPVIRAQPEEAFDAPMPSPPTHEVVLAPAGNSIEKNAESPEAHGTATLQAEKTQNADSETENIAFTVEQVPADTKEDDDPESKSKELVEKYGLYDHKLNLPKFQLPPVSLLKDYGEQKTEIDQEELEENKNRIVSLLKNFKVSIKEIKATIGPTVTLYEIVPEAGIRVAQIKKLQDDIALNLSALGIRIIAPMPGKGTIGIEVPNRKPTLVSMRSVINSSKFKNTDMALPIVFGKTISNEIFMADLAKMPHLLIAGATGQGKSVGINAILTSLLYKKHPSELKLVLVDPKKVELSLYSKIERHYLAKIPGGEEAIITDNNVVIDTLNSLCQEMDQRYDLLKDAFCKNLKEYNKKFSKRKIVEGKEATPGNPHRYLPYIVLVVDEFADLIMTAGKEVEHPIARLAQLARAVGIHLIVATQRPSVNVITGMIKANFPARAAFRVISGVDSRTILDSPGAEQLVGKGDMLYFNGNDLTRLQCAFVDTPEVERIADFIGEQRGYGGAYELPEPENAQSDSTEFDGDVNDIDALFGDAARLVVENQQGSTSMLQRKLKLGYNRAGRIMDQLEVHRVVGSFNGSKPREVLIKDLTTLEQILEELGN